MQRVPRLPVVGKQLWVWGGLLQAGLAGALWLAKPRLGWD